MPLRTAETADRRNFLQACSNGNMRGVRRALASGQLSPKDLDLGLRLATSEAHLEIITALFDLDVPMSPLAIGYLTGDKGRQDPRVIRLYFDRGLKPRKCTTSAGEPLLRFFYADCARELLERGVDPNRCGPRRISPLASALNKVDDDGGATFDLLVQYGAKVDSSLWFYALAWTTQTELKARFLLSRGIDPTTATSEKWGTPLHVAARFADGEVIQLLLDAGADPTARSNGTAFRGRTPAEVAEWKMRASSEHSGMKPVYQSTIELLKSAETKFLPLTIPASENTNTPTNMDLPAAKQTKVNRPLNIVDIGSSRSSISGSYLPADHSVVAPKNGKRKLSGEDSISSRTRSRTKAVF
ncbi:hypothetical protein AnigIFM56816_007710 [Aspergillus niger]|nr:hypothetical protein AnigIFM56816_007710 [Aspergillus niger]